MIITLNMDQAVVDAADTCARRLGLSRAAWLRLQIILALRQDGALPTPKPADQEGKR